MLSSRLLITALLSLFAVSSLAQTNPVAPEHETEINISEKTKAINAYRNPQPRDLTILAQTLAAEELDRAVLNRLMQEISTQPERTQARIGLSESQLREIFVANFLRHNHHSIFVTDDHVIRENGDAAASYGYL